jgi:hypothetical protein
MPQTTTKVRDGQYELGTNEDTPRREPPETIGVIRGGQVNDHRGGGFQRILGLSTSKWYVYKQVEHLRKYDDRSGTGVLNVVSLESEHDTKKAAVSAGERFL